MSAARLLAGRAVLRVLLPSVQQLLAWDVRRREDVLVGVEVRRPALPFAVVPPPEGDDAPAELFDSLATH